MSGYSSRIWRSLHESDTRSLLNSAVCLSTDASATAPHDSCIALDVPYSMENPSSAACLAARRTRSPSSANRSPASPTARTVFIAMSCRPPDGSMISPDDMS